MKMGMQSLTLVCFINLQKLISFLLLNSQHSQKSSGAMDDSEAVNPAFSDTSLGYLLPVTSPVNTLFQVLEYYSDVVVNFPASKPVSTYEGSAGEIGSIIIRRDHADLERTSEVEHVHMVQ